jgi:hypothetical protein
MMAEFLKPGIGGIASLLFMFYHTRWGRLRLGRKQSWDELLLESIYVFCSFTCGLLSIAGIMNHSHENTEYAEYRV